MGCCFCRTLYGWDILITVAISHDTTFYYMVLSPIQRLDEVLKIMNPPHDHEATTFRRVDITNILKTSFEFTDKEANEISNQMPQILDKLTKDEYITFDLDRYNRDNEKFGGAAFKYYIITFDGELFNQAGGYRQKFIDEAEEKVNQERQMERMESNAVLLVVWTRRLAFATVIAVLLLISWELVKHYCLRWH